MINLEANLKKEKETIHQILSINGYNNSTITAGSREHSKKDHSTSEGDQETESKMLVIPYVSNVSEKIRRVCKEFNIFTVFRSSRTLRSYLSRVKDKIPSTMNSSVIYKIPCSCGKVYIGETARRLEQRLAEHHDACIKGDERKSAIAEHAWTRHHNILWDEATVIDRAHNLWERKIKEAIHIQLVPMDGKFNRDVGLELPVSWNSLLRECTKLVKDT